MEALKCKYDRHDDTSNGFDMPREAMEALVAFGTAMCKAEQAANPDVAHCWTAFRFTVDDCHQPSFSFGGSAEEVGFADNDNVSDVVQVPIARKGK